MSYLVMDGELAISFADFADAELDEREFWP
jgi:hypothetical protein